LSGEKGKKRRRGKKQSTAAEYLAPREKKRAEGGVFSWGDKFRLSRRGEKKGGETLVFASTRKRREFGNPGRKREGDLGKSATQGLRVEMTRAFLEEEER